AAEKQDYVGVKVAPNVQHLAQMEAVPVRLRWRRAAPLELAGPAPAPVRQRWWLAGVIGAFFTAVIALLWVAFAR
ncbi:MAG: hypothetical protein RLZZ522_1085, partial [Verrucomicrobiota bacterium]